MRTIRLLIALALVSAAGGWAQNNLSFDQTFSATTAGTQIKTGSVSDFSRFNVCTFTYRLTGAPAGVSIAIHVSNGVATPTVKIAAVTTTTNATTIPLGTIQGPYRAYYAVIATLSGGTSPTIVLTTNCSPYSVGAIPGSGGVGTVTSVSAGNLSPIFTSAVATATTTPALSFSLTAAANKTVLGNHTGGAAVPSYIQLVCADLSDAGTGCAGHGMAIGGTVTSATQGSVFFAGAAGILSQDNAHLFWDAGATKLNIKNRMELTSTVVDQTVFKINATNIDGANALDIAYTENTSGASPTAANISISAAPALGDNVGSMTALSISTSKSGDGLANNVRGIRIFPSTITGGVVPNQFAIDIGDQAGATNNYAAKFGLGKITKTLASGGAVVFQVDDAGITQIGDSGSSLTGSTGSLTVTALSGTAEDLKLDLSAANAGTYSSSTGLSSLVFTGIRPQYSVLTASQIVQTDASKNLVSSNTLPTGTTLNGNTIISTSLTTAGLGAPIQVGVVRAVSQVAGIAYATIFTVGGSDAMFDANFAANCDTTSAAATFNITLRWTDPASQSQTATLGSAIVCTALGASSIGSLKISFAAKTATIIEYKVDIVNTPTFDIRGALYQVTSN